MPQRLREIPPGPWRHAALSAFCAVVLVGGGAYTVDVHRRGGVMVLAAGGIGLRFQVLRAVSSDVSPDFVLSAGVAPLLPPARRLHGHEDEVRCPEPSGQSIH